MPYVSVGEMFFFPVSLEESCAIGFPIYKINFFPWGVLSVLFFLGQLLVIVG